MNNEYRAITGLDDKKFRRLIRTVEPSGSALQKNGWDPSSKDFLIQLIKQEMSKPSLLDLILLSSALNNTATTYEAFIPSSMEEIVISALTNSGLEMLLFRDRDETDNSRIISAPLFEIEYRMENVNRHLPAEAITNGIFTNSRKFEGEFLFDLLNKALRSQRNRLLGGDSIGNVTTALELVEREGFSEIGCVLNTRFYAKSRELIRQCDGSLYNYPVYGFNPEGRLNKTRNYFVAKNCGVIVRAPIIVDVATSRSGDVFSHISCITRFGAMIFDRGGISAIED